MSLHQSGVELKGFPEVLLGEPSPMPPQLDLPGHETGLSGHWVSVGNSHQSRHGFLGAAVCDVEPGPQHVVRRCWLAEPAESIRGGLGKIDPAGAEVGFPRLPDCLGILRPAKPEVPESQHDGQDHDDRDDPGPAAACRTVELPARSLRTRVASLGRCFRSHASSPPGRPVVLSRPVDRPIALNNALAREKRSLIHSCRFLNIATWDREFLTRDTTGRAVSFSDWY